MRAFEKISHKLQAIVSRLKSMQNQGKMYYPMIEAVRLLQKEGVGVFFYNRVGFIKGYPYPESVKKRIKNKLSFPKMYCDIARYEKEFREIYGDKYSGDYIKSIGQIPQVIRKGNLFCHEDYASALINVVQGKRVTIGQPKEYNKTIHVYGRCGVFGYAVEDAETMPSLIQKKLTEKGYADIRVENHGLWGGEDSLIEHNFLEDVLEYGPHDIIVFYLRRFSNKLMKGLIESGMCYSDFTEEWHHAVEPVNCIYDRPGHMNAKGYEAIADLITTDLIRCSFVSAHAERNLWQEETPHLDQYLKKNGRSDLEEGITRYLNEIRKAHPLPDGKKECGAIVMNCNPFTKGHRYLIELAAGTVDRLYVFVVEENRSFFAFSDRMEMVRQGTADLGNVVVVPSGRYIISAFTFPEYFMKDYVKEKAFDVTGDVELFCKYIAPSLSITIRFAGEEPFDPITKKYNETMREILPRYGMMFREIPRLALDNDHIISATEVRKILKDKKYDAIKEYVPETTFRVLMEKYSEQG
ncbi:MAG: adenylyltransferase/cytidyltransferase family protein [Lachnospiraceae bacterium]|nr:adenylyltransferase/cytidyltransferase family protein [Lachnospiraceae bacterium]